MGAILAPLTVPWIASHWGWQAAFIIIGAIGFLWLIAWFMFYETPAKQTRLTIAEREYINSDKEVEAKFENGIQTNKISWLTLLRYQQTWAFAIGKFLTDGVWWFFLFWLPGYLKDQYSMQGTSIILPLSVLYSMTMVGSIGGGWLPTHFINKGYLPYEGRMKAMLRIAFVPLVVLAVQPLGDSKFVPCLGGAFNVESFRFYEAIENGAIPLVPIDAGDSYKNVLSDEKPALLLGLSDMKTAAQVMSTLLPRADILQKTQDDMRGWWLDYKKRLTKRIHVLLYSA